MKPSAKTTKAAKAAAPAGLSAKLSRALLIALPAILFFSYHPVISLGASSTMNFELSLPELWLVLFFFVSLPQLKSLVKFYGWKKLALSAVVPAYLTLSVLWSGNRPRTILTAGILWLLTYTILYLIYALKTTKGLKEKLQKSLLFSAAAVSVFCLLQCVTDLLGFSRDVTLLCEGCVSEKFGFPHPNGFAIEPQFMGNLLIAPILLCFYLLSASDNNKQKRLLPQKILIPLTLLLTITIFVTLSRGAIYACTIALIIEQVLLHRKAMKAVLKPLALFLGSVLIALSLQGLFAALSPTNDTFISGATKSIHQLSLGKIDLRPAETAKAADNSAENITAEDAAEASESSQFSGYVAESTDVRLNLNSLAFNTWKSKPQYIFLGTGLGSAGPAMHAYAPEELGEKEIVQNEYMSLLLETGLIGCILILAVGIYATTKAKLNSLFLSLLLGFALTLFFFSGLPNALHLYLLPALFI